MAKDTRAHEALGNELLTLIRQVVEERIRKFANGDRIKGGSVQGPIPETSIPSWVATDEELADEIAIVTTAINTVASDLADLEADVSDLTADLTSLTTTVTAHIGTIASAGTLGHIRIGSGLSIDGSGIVSISGVASHGSTHVSNGSDPIPAATSSVGGLFPAADKAKLDLLTLATATTITGGGTVALAGFTLTVPASGTVALLGTANTFTQNNSFGGNVSITGTVSAGNISTTPTADYIPKADGTGKIAAGWLPALTAAAHAATHLSNGSDPIASATTSVGGLMSSSDKTKLDKLTMNTTATLDVASITLGTEVFFFTSSGTGVTTVPHSGGNTFSGLQQIRVHLNTPNASALKVGWTSGDTTSTASFGSSHASNNQIAVEAVSTSAAGVQGTSSSGSGVHGISATSYGGRFVNTDSSTLITNALVIEHQRTTATNMGVALEFKATTSAGVEQLGRISYDWADSTSATRTSQCFMTILQNGTVRNVAKFDYNSSTSLTGFALLYGTALVRVQVGATDSGGVGFRMLRIPN